jgi:hypothetical protein
VASWWLRTLPLVGGRPDPGSRLFLLHDLRWGPRVRSQLWLNCSLPVTKQAQYPPPTMVTLP